jgi:hypothetical protein
MALGTPGGNKPSDNPVYQQSKQQLQQAYSEQISTAQRLTDEYNKSRQGIQGQRTTLANSKKFTYTVTGWGKQS